MLEQAAKPEPITSAPSVGDAPALGPPPRAQRVPEPGGDDSALLHAIGRRLRLVRTQRGMTRRLLSAQSGVSERYIAQVESGRGNGSVLLLHALATALGVPLVRLLEDPPDEAAPATRLMRAVGRLTRGQAEQTLCWLEERYGTEPAPMQRQRRIALVGLRGAGKSSLGRLLAARMGVPFHELDREIEREASVDLSEVFDLYGEAGYRRLERQVLQRLVGETEAAVIATGGGLVAEPATYELLLRHCLTVWVRASPEEHMQRVLEQDDDARPTHDNARAVEDLRAILASREPLYRRADLQLNTAGRSLPQSLRDLLTLLGRPA